jgi:hypothetical protein
MLLVAVIPAAWIGISLLVLAVCRMSARADTPAPGAGARAGTPANYAAHQAQRPAYSPRRPSTCGTVRSKILTSVHNDQLAT